MRWHKVRAAVASAIVDEIISPHSLLHSKFHFIDDHRQTYLVCSSYIIKRARVPETAEKSLIATSSAVRSDPLDDHAANFGRRLRRLMIRESVSLDKLSDFSGVGRNRLERITNGEIVPTISLIWKFANFFSVPFGSLISNREKHGSFVLREAQKVVLTSSDGRFTSRALFPYSCRRLVEFYEITIAQDHVENSVAHAPGTVESLVVTHGKIKVTSGKEAAQTLNKGDAFIFEADVPHSYRNLGKTEAVFHLVMSYDNLIGS
jgi:XRE family transcriptional regulator, regulator of sulfur utilization